MGKGNNFSVEPALLRRLPVIILTPISQCELQEARQRSYFSLQNIVHTAP